VPHSVPQEGQAADPRILDPASVLHMVLQAYVALRPTPSRSSMTAAGSS
jgi:hypothetical protein